MSQDFIFLCVTLSQWQSSGNSKTRHHNFVIAECTGMYFVCGFCNGDARTALSVAR
jgi:hypothetical protein